jgi:hypothetical protein
MILTHIWPGREHLATPEMQVCLPGGVMLLHFCDELLLILILLEHKCIPATYCCDGASHGDFPGWRTASLRVATGLHQSSYLLCTFFACMTVGTHIRSNSGPWGCRYAVSTIIGHMHSARICTRKASWGEQGTPVPGEHVHAPLVADILVRAPSARGLRVYFAN